MSEVETQERFLDLIEAAEDIHARLAVRSPEGWIDRGQLVETTDGAVYRKYILDSTPSGRLRYSMKVKEGNLVVEEWKRHVFPVNRIAGSDKPVEDDLEIVVELTFGEGCDAPESVSWEGEEIVLSSDVLTYESDFPPVNADRVAGLEDEKQRLERFLDGSEEDWGLGEATGVILEGPPGTGKTELMMEICQERYGSMPVMISGPEILSKWVGESERMLREKFDEAWNTKHGVLYIDELDAIARARIDVSESYSAQIVAQLLVLLDGVEAKKQAEEGNRSLKVVASTNLSHVVDPALRRPGRLGNRPIRFSRPDQADRKAILHHYLENIHVSDDGRLSKPLQTFVTGDDLAVVDDVVEETEGFTGADLEDLVQEAVSQRRERGRDVADVDLLETVLDQGGFGEERDFEEREIPRTDLTEVGAPDRADYASAHPEIRMLDEDGEPSSVAARHFKRVVERADLNEDVTCKFRAVGPKEILDSDSMRAKENAVQAFQHRENERICLYLKNTELLLQGKANSGLIDRLVGVVNEEFLQWENENLLIIDPIPDDMMASFLDMGDVG